MQVSQRLLAVEMAPVLLQTIDNPFAPTPVTDLATPASRQVLVLSACAEHHDVVHMQALVIVNLTATVKPVRRRQQHACPSSRDITHVS